jgi:hypothetical protein
MTFFLIKMMGTKEEKMARMFQERITSWKESQVG